MPNILIGCRYRVCDGCGLDSGREGRAVWPSYFMREIEREEGRYKPFKATGRMSEGVFVDDNGQVFTMFKSLVRRVDAKV